MNRFCWCCVGNALMTSKLRYDAFDFFKVRSVLRESLNCISYFELDQCRVGGEL